MTKKALKKKRVTIRLTKQEAKLLALAQYACSQLAKHKNAPMSLEKLGYLLYFADITAYRVIGHPLTGWNWMKTKSGIDFGSRWRAKKKPS